MMPDTTTHPYPRLDFHPNSGLSFEWAEDQSTSPWGSSAMHLGTDGVGVGFVMWIYWEDLETALQELLGYSYRDTTTTTPNGAHWLRRLMPWQHPYFNQMVVKAVMEVKGGILQGNSEDNDVDLFLVAKGGMGAGYQVNNGPWSEFFLAKLTVAFWRPPYFLRSDDDILDDDGNPQEWLRFTDKRWEVSNQMLSQQGNCFNWVPNQVTTNSTGPPGSIGRPITHQKVVRRWYEVPEACLFADDWPGDGTPGGQAYNQLYTKTSTTNPITGYAYLTPSPINFTVNSPVGGEVNDDDPTTRFFGCYMGTLRFDAVEFIQRPLQLPAVLMQIPTFNTNQAVSQVQYDVAFHFDLFDPPRSSTVANSVVMTTGGATIKTACRGHNLVPFYGDGQWYAIRSQNVVGGTTKFGTMFNYADHSDLWRVL